MCVRWKEFSLPPIWHVFWTIVVLRQKYVYKKRCEKKDGNVYTICNSAYFVNKWTPTPSRITVLKPFLHFLIAI